MIKCKTLVAAIALTLGFVATGISAAQAYSYNDTLKDGNGVEISLRRHSAGGFKGRIEADNPVKSLHIELWDGDNDLETIASETSNNDDIFTVTTSKEPDDIVGYYRVKYLYNGSTTLWSHTLECDNGSYSD